ncbi:MAG TPA: hypothetical protein VF158_08225 [Longimicrobiales bacterium]
MASRGRKKNGGRARGGSRGASRAGSRAGSRTGSRGAARGRPRAAAREAGRSNPARRAQPAKHLAVGYTDRETLDRFIAGEGGDVVVHGPIHAGRAVAEVATLGAGATQGMPCVVVPLVREQMDEIRREVSDVLDRFEAGAARAREGRRPRTIRETGGSARGASAGAIRSGAGAPERE